VHRHGVAGALGLTLLGLASAAGAADVPGGTGTRATAKTGLAGVRGVFEKPGDSDWYRIALKGGQSYAVVASPTNRGCLNVRLRTAAGKVIDTAGSYQDNDDGFEYRPGADGTFFLEFKDRIDCPNAYPAQYRGNVTADARGDPTTAATIAVGRTIHGYLNWGYDQDYFRTRLRAGVGYTATATIGTDSSLRLVDAGGKVLLSQSAGTPLRFTVPASGTYYLVADASDDSAGNSYPLTLAAP
jgi:hypothetical protein